MEGVRFIRTARLTNFLSYGPTAQEVELGPLNVLIGPNASGKSNLIEAISLLHAAPVDIGTPIREGGGVAEWPWKGADHSRGAEIDITAYYPDGRMPLRHVIRFNEVGQRLEIEDERIEDEHPCAYGKPDPIFYYRYQDGHPVLNTRSFAEAEGVVAAAVAGRTLREGSDEAEGQRFRRALKRETINPAQSILAQKKDADVYPELTYLGEQYGKIRTYRDWSFGRNAPPRRPQRADLPNDFLLDDASNIALVLNSLVHHGARPTIREKLRLFSDDIEDITANLEGGTVQVFAHEKSLSRAPVPATRFSDGMMRYLCLLCVLCHPKPPPLVCIEEPELCLHPDVIPAVAELLVEAAQRTQLIVTTHSDTLVSALSEVPEAVLVCERDENGTTLQRLDPEKLKDWLEKYRLGDLWRMGELGGVRT